MKALFDGTAVRCGREGYALYDQGGYGRRERDGLTLAPPEALYLLQRGRIAVQGYDFEALLSAFASRPGFLRSYLVYRDLRERGYAVQTGPHDFRVFRRGQRPGTGESLYLVRVVSERDPIRFSDLITEATTAHNLRKLYVLAAVDDENELTYYEVKIAALPGIPAGDRYPQVEGVPAGTSVMAPIPAGTPFEAAWLGSRLDESRLLFSPLETYYLAERGVLKVTSGDTPLSGSALFARAEEGDGEFAPKAAVFADLRDRGYVPKTGYKFGHHFRVYSGKKPHSELLVHAVEEGVQFPMSTISRSVRLAHSVKKKMLFAAVHRSGIRYVEFARIKL